MIEFQVCSKGGPHRFSKEKAKIHWQSFQIFYKNTGPITCITNLGMKHPWVKRIQGFTNKDHSNFKNR